MIYAVIWALCGCLSLALGVSKIGFTGDHPLEWLAWIYIFATGPLGLVAFLIFRAIRIFTPWPCQ